MEWSSRRRRRAWASRSTGSGCGPTRCPCEQSMRILITGGCGFVGAFTALELVGQGQEVVCFDRRAVRNDVLTEAGPDVAIEEGDIRDRERLAAVVREHRIEGIAHTAAVIGQGDGAADPDWMLGINVGGTVSVLE